MSQEIHQGDLEDAIAGPDEKVQPGEVPIATYTGCVRSEHTGNFPLLVFNTDDGSTIAVRTHEADLSKMLLQLPAFRESDEEDT